MCKRLGIFRINKVAWIFDFASIFIAAAFILVDATAKYR